MTANGTINAGYNDSYGSDIESSHGLGVGGAAALNGFFYNPNFVNFNINPYYNQSRSNSGTGSISDASGVTLSSGIFGGSHFPGSVNYSTAFNSTGNYGIPGISSLNTNGNSQNFGINWGEFVLPACRLYRSVTRWAAATIISTAPTKAETRSSILSTSAPTTQSSSDSASARRHLAR